MELERSLLVEKVNAAWSPENFFRVWTYMHGRVDYNKSHPLGQYYSTLSTSSHAGRELVGYSTRIISSHGGRDGSAKT
ncbi:hypothetical protein N656DRAFT_778550 [Canariomyces notabilis]|uniref:Uncharacterized protein n=1 Tax=Canariomyces notabilis TaxID=2074819 RepID=A0AAN6TEN7_9PEZI|nr:hypothetical protein N656DRAFT_778550 [Canariomyces arenarius]